MPLMRDQSYVYEAKDEHGNTFYVPISQILYFSQDDDGFVWFHLADGKKLASEVFDVHSLTEIFNDLYRSMMVPR
jgi:ligand-binding sensor domain-containing protein